MGGSTPCARPRYCERHRKRWFTSITVFGAFAGVDAPVPHLLLAASRQRPAVRGRPCRRGWCRLVASSIRARLAAQAHGGWRTARAEAGLARRGGLSSAVRGAGGGHRWLAQLLQRQLLVNPCDRQCSPAAGAPGAVFGTQGLPFSAPSKYTQVPSWRAGGLMAAMALLHLLPLAGTQARTFQPSRSSFRSRPWSRCKSNWRHRDRRRRLLANHAPRPSCALRPEVQPICCQQRGGSVVRLAHGPCIDQDQRQPGRYSLPRAVAWAQGCLGGRTCGDLNSWAEGLRRDDLHRIARHARLVAFTGRRALRQTSRAAVAWRYSISRRVGREPSSMSRWGHTSCGNSSGGVAGAGGPDAGLWQGVAAHLAVVRHPVAGCWLATCSQSRALAQQQQPVVAQAVFLVGAGVALQKALISPRLARPGGSFSSWVAQGSRAWPRGGQQRVRSRRSPFAERPVHLSKVSSPRFCAWTGLWWPAQRRPQVSKSL